MATFIFLGPKEITININMLQVSLEYEKKTKMGVHLRGGSAESERKL